MGWAPATYALVSAVTTTASMAMQAYSAAQQSKASKNAYNYQAAVGRNNALIADWNAKEEARRGEQNLIEHQRKTAALTGTQRAAFAGRGIDMSEGSALNILSDTEYLSGQDQLTIKDNTAKAVWQAKMQAYNEGTNAELLQMRSDSENPLFSGAASLLTGAGTVADRWYRYKAAS